MALETTQSSTLKLAAINLALIHVGQSKPISGLSESSEAAQIASTIIDQELEACLREYPWSFATKYADPLVVEDGSATTPTNRDWQYAYIYPDDCLFARRLLTAAGRAYEPNPLIFRKGRLNDKLILFANEPDAGLEYTAIFDCPVQLADRLFIEALSWRLAAQFAPTLARNKRTANECLQTYYLKLDIARTVDAQEQQVAKPGEADWIRGR
jgi:hypothetical protein